MVAQQVQDIGIDVAKRWLDVAVFQTQEQAHFDNDKDGWAKLVRWLRGRPVRAIGMEPSGGYERGVAKALRTVDLPARNVNPHKLRHTTPCPWSAGQERSHRCPQIARYTAELPTRPVRCDPIAGQLADLVVARRQLSDDKVSLADQLEQLREPMVRRIFTPRLRRIEFDIALLAKHMAELVASQPALAAKDRLIQSFYGAGLVLSHTILALAPEIGQASRREIAALAGLAPHDFDTGTFRGRRIIWGGRHALRWVVYGCPDRRPIKSRPQGFPPASHCQGQGTQSRSRRRGPKDHPQRHAQTQPTLESTQSLKTQLLIPPRADDFSVKR